MRDTPLGKVVDRDQALGLSLGLIGRQAERLDALEGSMGAMSDDEAKKYRKRLGGSAMRGM